MSAESTLGDLRKNWHRYLSNWLEWLVLFGKSGPDRRARFEELLRSECHEPPDRRGRPTRYVASSLFLHRCHRYLTQGEPEQLHLVTGFRVNGCFVLNEMVKLPNIRRSRAGAFAGPSDTREGLLLMESFGLYCCGLFHSHPGRGLAGASPSALDRRNQQVWERAYPLVGAVFSRDGYVRFFTNQTDVRVDVFGRKVRRIDENVFKLEVGQDLSLPRPSRPSAGR